MSWIAVFVTAILWIWTHSLWSSELPPLHSGKLWVSLSRSWLFLLYLYHHEYRRKANIPVWTFLQQQLNNIHHGHKMWLFILLCVLSINMEKVGCMTYTAASHQVAIKMLWLHFWVAVMLSNFKYSPFHTFTPKQITPRGNKIRFYQSKSAGVKRPKIYFDLVWS